jgi:hypothetical protein
MITNPALYMLSHTHFNYNKIMEIECSRIHCLCLLFPPKILDFIFHASQVDQRENHQEQPWCEF